jgi:hypothetical protein
VRKLDPCPSRDARIAWIAGRTEFVHPTRCDEDRGREAGDATGRDNDRVTGIVPEVAEEVVGLLVADVLDHVAGAGAATKSAELSNLRRLLRIFDDAEAPRGGGVWGA